jgi:hypothetical protein
LIVKTFEKGINNFYPSNDGYNFAFESFLIGVHMKDL